MKTIEKKHKKIIGPAGSRTSTRQRLARGLGPDSVWPEDFDPYRVVFPLTRARAFKAPRAARVQPGYYYGALQRDTTGKYNGETKRETKWKNKK